ncbi:MAG TPA: hypothetical protein DIW81_09065 [Planctomycetaceae bacterium]|nr:hypothetical protein [Rubinisphaera sp.]HCS51727.1 hypothetical protein [Planctomycetaceae bacterium]|tara:strand:- start:416 stop:682 length:267 start_codon:yes stop_codon:yes gene_type:complete
MWAIDIQAPQVAHRFLNPADKTRITAIAFHARIQKIHRDFQFLLTFWAAQEYPFGANQEDFVGVVGWGLFDGGRTTFFFRLLKLPVRE